VQPDTALDGVSQAAEKAVELVRRRKHDPRNHTKRLEVGIFLVLLSVVSWIVVQFFISLIDLPWRQGDELATHLVCTHVFSCFDLHSE